MRLVVVESPNKVRKIGGFLGSGYRVAASFGHVADLPPGGDLAISFSEGRVEPRYQPLERSQRAISELRAAAAQADEVLLATDPDREGEAIAWHVQRLLGDRPTYRRVVFQAITADAVRKAVAAPRVLDQHLVDAQQARRVLDRVVGWLVSPTLRKGAGDPRARSAGRVQSAALRLVVERERAITAHTKAEYQVLEAQFAQDGKPPPFRARLVDWKGAPLEQRLHDKATASAAADWCKRQRFVVSRCEHKEQRRRPPAPFVTASVQQAASVRLKVDPERCMSLLQRLFEDGRITYHRTDSTALAPEAVEQARAIILERFGGEYLPKAPVVHGTKSANAQEAHEAIRPTDATSGPNAVDGEAGPLYKLIWERFIACQMADAVDLRAQIDVDVAPGAWVDDAGRQHPMGRFRAVGKTPIFPGWRACAEDATDERSPRKGRRKKSDDDEESEAELPQLMVGDEPQCTDMTVQTKATKAPPRYTQASLIKKLEQEGIGRPSTYAAILSTLSQREYVAEKRRKLHATELGDTVVTFLCRHFEGNFIDIGFTARMEDALDGIARGDRPWEPLVTGAARAVRDLARAAGLWYDPLGEVDRVTPEPPPIDTPCPLCQSPVEPRVGPFGPYYRCTRDGCSATLRADGSPSASTRKRTRKP